MNSVEKTRIAIMDTTLRDGEQTPNVAYTPLEKLQVAKFELVQLGVDRVEIASSRVSAGELEGARLITSWARENGVLDRVEMLGFVDDGRSVEWILSAGGRAMNLLTKGSERHCRTQLQMPPSAHLAAIRRIVGLAHDAGCLVNVYLEDWSNGIADSFEYVVDSVELLRELGIRRIYLSDTLGVLTPELVSEYVGKMCARWPDQTFEFHGHNDYGLGTVNCLASLAAGAAGVHTSINGLGERAGNASLSEVVVAIHDHTPFCTGVQETALLSASRLIETFSGKRVAANAPVVGHDVFTQTAGIHADGDAKGNLYMNRLDPRRFGREREYALGKMAGKASLEQNLKRIGIDLPESERNLVLKRITELGDKKHVVEPDDLPFIIADVLQHPPVQTVRIVAYHVALRHDTLPNAEVTVRWGQNCGTERASGAGGYDAVMSAVRAFAQTLSFELPALIDYQVRIPPGGRTEALVETIVSWRKPDGRTFSTRGVDSDQLAAAIIATEKMLNIVVTDAQKPPSSGGSVE